MSGVSADPSVGTGNESSTAVVADGDAVFVADVALASTFVGGKRSESSAASRRW